MLEKILTKMAKVIYPERDIHVAKIGHLFFLKPHIKTGVKTYLLEGTYSYQEVLKLNDLTTFCAGFGFCAELGPVAFIGVPSPASAQKNGYFEYKVESYGSTVDHSECYFKAYTMEEAKNIGNYTVYGLYGLSDVSTIAPISQISYYYDSRFIAKITKQPKVFDMDCQIKGVFSYNEAKLLVTRTLKKEDSFSAKDQPIVFATVGNGQHVGILNMCSTETALVQGFRDVWEYGAEEPETQTISFLSKEEASKIEDFTLYIYNYATAGICKDKYQIEKSDRTLDKSFRFQLPNGSDYRLVEHTELFK